MEQWTIYSKINKKHKTLLQKPVVSSPYYANRFLCCNLKAKMENTVRTEIYNSFIATCILHVGMQLGCLKALIYPKIVYKQIQDTT